MFLFNKRKAQSQEKIGISLQPDGVAFARINTDTQPPQLLDCAFESADDSESIQDSLQTILKQHRLTDSEVVLVLDKADFTFQTMESPQVETSEKVQAIRWKLKDVIDFDVGEAIVDIFDVPQPSGSSRQEMVYVVAADQKVLQEKATPLLDKDIQLEVIDIPELTQRNIAELLPEDGMGVALLALEADSGLLTLTHKSSLYLSRQLDFGHRELDRPQASDDSDMSVVGMSPDLQRAMDQIVLEVQRSLDYYESHFGLAPISSLIIAPLAIEVPGLLNYMASQLGVQVRMLDLSAILDISEPIERPKQAACWAAIGAALRHDNFGIA